MYLYIFQHSVVAMIQCKIYFDWNCIVSLTRCTHYKRTDMGGILVFGNFRRSQGPRMG